MEQQHCRPLYMHKRQEKSISTLTTPASHWDCWAVAPTAPSAGAPHGAAVTEQHNEGSFPLPVGSRAVVLLLGSTTEAAHDCSVCFCSLTLRN